MTDRDDALRRRMEESYKTREGENKFMMYFQPDSEIHPLRWTPDKGDHDINIIPYDAGPNDPHTPEGEPTYCLDIYIHQNVGPRDRQFVCPDWNYKGKCPICEHRNKLLKDPPEGDREKKRHDDLTYALKPKRRTVYNIIVMTDAKEEAKGLRVLEIAHHFLEKELQTLAGRGKAKGKGYIFYAHPTEGRLVCFSRTGTGAKSTSYGGYSLEDRDYDLPQEWLDAALALDEHIVAHPTYEEIAEAFWDEAEGEGEGGGKRAEGRSETADQGSDSAEETARSPRGRRGARPSEEATAEAAEGTPRSPRKRRTVDGASPAPEDESRAPEAPAEDKEPPRRLGKAGGTKPAEPEGEPEAASVEKAPNDRCDVPNGRYGVDTDKFEECDTCEVWKSCVASAERRKRA